MMASLSIERMWLSDDEDDWCWGRWKWCRPGALPLEPSTAYGFPLWETSREGQILGPRFDLTGGVYARSRVSSYPGLDHEGLAEWYATGLPLDQRPAFFDYSNCGSQHWWTDVDVGCDVEQLPDAAVLSFDGGIAVGGEMIIMGPCPFFYGSCVHFTGGAAVGGEMEFLTGESLLGEGGAAVGGEMEFDTGGSLLGEGGAAVGGEMEFDWYSPVTWVNGWSSGSTDSSSPANIDLPFGSATQDDLAVICIYMSVGLPSQVNTPAGWTRIAEGTTHGGTRGYLFLSRVCQAGDPITVTISWTGSASLTRAAFVVRGGYSAKIVASAEDTSTTPAIAGTHSASGGTMWIASYQGGSTATVVTPPSAPWTLGMDSIFHRPIWGYHADNLSSVTPGGLTATASITWQGFLFAVEPIATGVVPTYMGCTQSAGGTFNEWTVEASGGTGDFATFNGSNAVPLASGCTWTLSAGSLTVNLTYQSLIPAWQVSFVDGMTNAFYQVAPGSWNATGENVLTLSSSTGSGTPPATVTVRGTA